MPLDYDHSYVAVSFLIPYSFITSSAFACGTIAGAWPTDPVSGTVVLGNILTRKGVLTQFMVLGKYSNQGLGGFIQNPNDDRRAAISSMMEKAGGKLIDLHLTRGEYDIVAVGEVDSFEDIAAVMLLVASSGAVENLTILEMIDMNSIANKAAAIAGA